MNVFALITTLGVLNVAQAQNAPTPAAAPRPLPPPMRFGPSPEQQAKTQEDHQHLLELLKITSLRPGPSGNPNAPNAANADESKVCRVTFTAKPRKGASAVLSKSVNIRVER